MLSKSCEFIRNAQMARGIVSKSVSKGVEISKRLEASLEKLPLTVPKCTNGTRHPCKMLPKRSPRGGAPVAGWGSPGRGRDFRASPPPPQKWLQGRRGGVFWSTFGPESPRGSFWASPGSPPGPLGRPPRPSLTAFLRGVPIAGGTLTAFFTWGPNCRVALLLHFYVGS